MKNLLIPAFLLLGIIAKGQTITWSSPVSVSTSTYGNLHPRVTLDKNGNPLLLWGNSNSSKAYFSRWTGSAFSTPIALNPGSIPVFASDWAGPDITSHGDTVYAVFKQTPETDSTKHIYVTKSFDGGVNFSAPVRVDYIGDSLSRFPIVTTDDIGNPLVAFMKFDPTFGDARYVFSKSSDFGNSFSSDIKASTLAGDVCDCCPASILSSGNRRIILYRNNLSNIRTMWAGVSTNNGGSFSNTQVDSTNWMVMACPSSGPDGIIVGDTLYSTFMSQPSSMSRIYQSKTSISTGTVSSTSFLSNGITGLSSENYPRMANAGNAAAVVCRQTVSGQVRIALSFTDNVTKGFPTTPEVVATGGLLRNADVALSQGIVHVVWEDDNSGTVMYRKGVYSLGVKQLTAGNKPINVFPNPAGSYVSVSGDADITNCILTDITGRQTKLQTTKTNGSTIIRLNEIATGMYYMLLQDTKGTSYFTRLVIQPE